jgi:hypothetical protein
MIPLWRIQKLGTGMRSERKANSDILDWSWFESNDPGVGKGQWADTCTIGNTEVLFHLLAIPLSFETL